MVDIIERRGTLVRKNTEPNTIQHNTQMMMMTITNTTHLTTYVCLRLTPYVWSGSGSCGCWCFDVWSAPQQSNSIQFNFQSNPIQFVCIANGKRKTAHGVATTNVLVPVSCLLYACYAATLHVAVLPWLWLWRSRVRIVVVFAANPPLVVFVWYSCSCSFILFFVFCTVGGYSSSSSSSRMTPTTMTTMIRQTAPPFLLLLLLWLLFVFLLFVIIIIIISSSSLCHDRDAAHGILLRYAAVAAGTANSVASAVTS